MLKLIDANEEYLDQYIEAYQESLKQVELGQIKKHNLTFTNPEEHNVIEYFNDMRDTTKLPPNYVPSYNYFAVDGDKFIGEIHIRVRLVPHLINYGGHIGYAINPKYRKMGYGKEMLKLGLEKAKDLIEEDNILITCDDDNIGSYKVIEYNGGILENKVENEDQGEKFLTRRYWIKK